MKKALDFLVQYVGNPSSFPYKEISNWESAENGLGVLIYRGARYFNEPEYQKIWEDTFEERLESEWILLVMPSFEGTGSP